MRLVNFFGLQVRWRDVLPIEGDGGHHTSTKVRQAPAHGPAATLKGDEVMHLTMPYIAIAPHQTSSSGLLAATTLVGSRGDGGAPQGTMAGRPPNGITGGISQAVTNGSIPGLYHMVTSSTSISPAEVVASNSMPGLHRAEPYQTAVSMADPIGGGNTVPGSIAGENHQHASTGMLAAVVVRGGNILGSPPGLRTTVPTTVTIAGDSTSESSFDGTVPTTTVVQDVETIPGQPHQRILAQPHRQSVDGATTTVVIDGDSTSTDITPGASSVDHGMPAGVMIRSNSIPEGARVVQMGLPAAPMPKSPEVSILTSVRVAGVEVVESLSECISCANRVVPDTNDPELGTCSQCSMMQRMDDTNVMLGTSLVLRIGEREFLPLRAFGAVVEFIAQKPAAEVSRKALLKAEPFTISHRDGIILSATRCTESESVRPALSLHNS